MNCVEFFTVSSVAGHGDQGKKMKFASGFIDMRHPLWPFIDIHLHLQDPVFNDKLDTTVQQALELGIAGLVVNGSKESDWERVLDLAERFPRVIPCLGLHPWYVAGRSENWLSRLETLLRTIRAGIGEIGLDQWIEPREEKAQEEVFRLQLDLARRLQRPVMIHCLKAWGWMMDVFQSEDPLPAGMLLHAYGGALEFIDPLTKLGAYFSFGGNVLEEKRTRMRAALQAVPLDRLLVESDAPDLLPPEPFRPHAFLDGQGKLRNHPANLPTFFRAMAELRGEEPVALSRIVWDNSLRFLRGLTNLKECSLFGNE
jgi:TatD DNase family protein